MNATVEFGHARCDVPEGYRPMTDAEKEAYYPGAVVGHAFLDESRRAVARFDAHDVDLAAHDVEKRLSEYYANYARMAPGFQAGETLKRDIPGGTVGIMSFKSNAPTRDLFNILAIISAGGKEHLALFSCDVADAAGLALTWSKTFADIRVADAEGLSAAEGVEAAIDGAGAVENAGIADGAEA